MIREIVFPMMATRMRAATLATWLVDEGEPLAVGQPLLDVTTDKVTLEVESRIEGILRRKLAKEGDLLPVESVIGLATTAGEEISEETVAKYPPFAPAPPLTVSCEITPELGDEMVPLDAMRTVIAQRMSIARNTMPHFYLTTVIDMTAAIEMRQRLKREKKIRISYNDMLLKASGLALSRYPQVASLFTSFGYVIRHRMHVGFAVSIEPDGLVVPVIRDADKRPLQEISHDAKELMRRAHSKKLTPDDYGFGVFTVSNLGSYEVDQFTAIINPVNAAILAVGKITETPVAVDGKVEIRPLMKITLSSDHRVIDGVLAAKFNGHLKTLLEDPEQLFDGE